MDFQTDVSIELVSVLVVLHLLQHTPVILAVPWLRVALTPLEIQALYPHSWSPSSQQGCPSHVP
jgi:hypothetical protein